MKFVIATVLLALLPGLATGEENWLEIIKSEDGFRFNGPAAEERFSFNIPGGEIRTTEDSGRAFADIDGAIVQVFRVPLELFPGADKLAVHAAYETSSLKASGARISKSEVCAGIPTPHQEWLADFPSHSTSLFFTFEVRRSVIVVVVAYDNEPAAKVAKRHLESICASLRF